MYAIPEQKIPRNKIAIHPFQGIDEICQGPDVDKKRTEVNNHPKPITKNIMRVVGCFFNPLRESVEKTAQFIALIKTRKSPVVPNLPVVKTTEF